MPRRRAGPKHRVRRAALPAFYFWLLAQVKTAARRAALGAPGVLPLRPGKSRRRPGRRKQKERLAFHEEKRHERLVAEERALQQSLAEAQAKEMRTAVEAAKFIQRVYRGHMGRRRFWVEQNAQRKERALVLSRYERLRESAMLGEVEEVVELGEELGHDTHRCGAGR